MDTFTIETIPLRSSLAAVYCNVSFYVTSRQNSCRTDNYKSRNLAQLFFYSTFTYGDRCIFCVKELRVNKLNKKLQPLQIQKARENLEGRH